MHMADALLSPAVATVMYACSAAAAGHSVRHLKLSEDKEKIPVMGVMGAFVFGAQMINFTIPGTGSSGHLCGGMLLSAVLGPEAGFVTMIAILLIQCLVFADGGLLALGANVWNMAFYGCFVGGYLIWRGFLRRGATRGRILAASLAGCVLTLQLGAFSVVLETSASRITELPFGLFLAVMQPIHLAIGLVEGLITAAVLVFLYEVRPELLWGTENERPPRWPAGKVIGAFAVLAVVVAGIVSLFASANPDGLEWSIARVAGTEELEQTGGLYAFAERLQAATAVFPDYSLKSSESVGGTSVSGIVGGVLVVLVCALFCGILKWIRKKKRDGQVKACDSYNSRD